MNCIHTLDVWSIGGIQELVLNIHRFSKHRHDAWGHPSTHTPYMEAVGIVTWPGGPPKEMLESGYYSVCISHTVGGWSHKDVFTWAKQHNMGTIEVMHSNHLSPTPPELVDHFVGLSPTACAMNPQMKNRSVIYSVVDVPALLKHSETGNRTGIGKLCRLVHEKCPLDFVEIARHFPNEQFVLAGDGPLMGEVASRRPPNLELPGFVRDFPDFYSSLKLFVAPTRDECNSTAVAMAMSAGVPLIYQNITAKEATGGHAVYANNVSEFVQLVGAFLENPMPFHDNSLNGKRWALDHFDVPVTVGAWDALCEGLL